MYILAQRVNRSLTKCLAQAAALLAAAVMVFSLPAQAFSPVSSRTGSAAISRGCDCSKCTDTACCARPARDRNPEPAQPNSESSNSLGKALGATHGISFSLSPDFARRLTAAASPALAFERLPLFRRDCACLL